MPETPLVKILFRFYSDILEEETVETMWAEVVDAGKGYFQIDNIPFYVPLLASGDMVHADFNEAEGMLTYLETVEYSGNSTIHVMIMNEEYYIDLIRQIFHDLGCASEKMNGSYFALEVPANINYLFIKQRLEELEGEDIISYAESGLADGHQYRDISF